MSQGQSQELPAKAIEVSAQTLIPWRKGRIFGMTGAGCGWIRRGD